MKLDYLSKLDDHTIGIIAGILSAVGYGFTSALVHIVADSVPATEVTFMRGVIGLLIIFPFVKRRLGVLFRWDVPSVWVRAIAGAISILCFTWNLQHTDVGTANILFNLSLILILFAEYKTGESAFSFKSAGCMFFVLIGTCLYWYGNKFIASSTVLTVGVIGAIAATTAYAALKVATGKVDSWLINWAVCLLAIPVSLIAKSGNWSTPSSTEWGVLTAIAIGNLIDQYLLNISFAKLPLSIATALVPISIVWSVLSVAVIQGIAPPINALLGAAIYAVGIGALVADSKKRQRMRNVQASLIADSCEAK